MSAPQFDKNTDKIAISIRSFTLKRLSEGGIFNRRAEPYIVSLAADSHGSATPELSFLVSPFPNMRKGQKKIFHSHGHLVYGPRQPGDFAAYSLLFMESDDDVRTAGARISSVLAKDTTKTLLKAVMTARPDAALLLQGLNQVASIVAGAMEQNRDDKLFRTGGVLLRDHPSGQPYDVLSTTVDGNDYIECETTVIPLPGSGGTGERSFNEIESVPPADEMFSRVQTIAL